MKGIEMTHSAIAIYTGKPTETILEDGGSQAWVLDKRNAQKAEYGVLCFNPHAEWSKGNVGHGAAFLIGRISGVTPSPIEPERSIILFDEYAEVNLPDTWGGWRNPVKYTSLEELGIDVETLIFQPMPKKASQSPEKAVSKAGQPLTIEAAKAGLALTFGVKPEAVEITIRG